VTQTNAALPFNDVKSLIFVAVNVRGWAAPGRHQGFHHEISASGLFPCNEERVHVSWTPESSAGSRRDVNDLSFTWHRILLSLRHCDRLYAEKVYLTVISFLHSQSVGAYTRPSLDVQL